MLPTRNRSRGHSSHSQKQMDMFEQFNRLTGDLQKDGNPSIMPVRVVDVCALSDWKLIDWLRFFLCPKSFTRECASRPQR